LGSEFAGELELALAERALAAAEGKPQLASPLTPLTVPNDRIARSARCINRAAS
jgi:hypothetical protein